MCRYLKRFYTYKKINEKFSYSSTIFLRMPKIIKIGWIVPVPKNAIQKKKKKNRFGPPEGGQKLR